YQAHGEPLGPEGVKATKEHFGWPTEPDFYVPKDALEQFRRAIPRGEELEADWDGRFERYRRQFPDLAQEWEDARGRRLRPGWDDDLPAYTPNHAPIATRDAGGAAMNAIAQHVPTLFGGDADLAPSTKSYLKGMGDFEPGSYGGRNIHFGVREHAMGSIVNGMSVNGMLWPYGATFFAFSDYQRPSVRLASIMKAPSIFIYTHDSVLLGEDGPTHQPVEQLMSLRAMPGLVVIRPADATESVAAWRWVMQHGQEPVALVLTRQKVPVLDHAEAAGALDRGAYVLHEAPGNLDIILMATGSEVALCVDARQELAKRGIGARVVSFPSWEIFERQDNDYQESVFPPGVQTRLSVEAGATFGWCRWIGDQGGSIGINHFGASAPLAQISRHFGLNDENVVERASQLVRRNESKHD
ncbi:MAG: transketolase-like TK C-terminal-containing protein, partial [Chloroflexota bacterium]